MVTGEIIKLKRGNYECHAALHYDGYVIHILDMGGAYTSVTNAVNSYHGLVDILKERFHLNHNTTYLLYGTDGIVSNYDINIESFSHVKATNPMVYQPFLEQAVKKFN